MYKGELVGTVKEYSDALLIEMLRARRPDRYRQRGELHVTGSLSPPDLEAIRNQAEDPELLAAFDLVAEALARKVREEEPPE